MYIYNFLEYFLNSNSIIINLYLFYFSAIKGIKDVSDVHKKYWKSLKFGGNICVYYSKM